MLYERPHEAEEERQKKRSDMAAVDIGIGHDDDLVIPELVEVEFVADAGAERRDDGLELVVVGCIVALVIQGIVSGWMDAVSIYICPLGAMLAAIMFFWVAGKDFALNAVNQGRDKNIGPWFVPLGKYVLVPLAFIALVAGAILGGIG